MLTAIIFGIFVGAMTAKSQDCNISTADYKDICLTPGCVHTASRVLEYMDPNVEPCDDFYRFACGKYIENTDIPDYHSKVIEFYSNHHKVQKQLRISFEEKVNPNEQKHFNLVKKLYQNCMNQTAINQKGLQSVLKLVKTLGGWPVSDGEIDQPNFGLPREYLIKGFSNNRVKAYYNYMVDIAVIFGADRARAESELRESLEFEMKLANISLPSKERRNMTALFNLMTVKELQTMFPSISWEEYFNSILNSIVQIDDNEVVIVNVPTFFKDFEILMQQTPKRIQANYVIWRAVVDIIHYLGENIRRRQLKYNTAITGEKERKPRWKECMHITSKNLELSVGALYVRKYFNEDSKKSVVEMTAGIITEFRKILETVEWMDTKTRKSALEKAMSMSAHIAYPDELLDDKKLEEYYNKLEINSGDYFQSILNFTLFKTDYRFSQLEKPFNKTDWRFYGSSSIVNAFYFSSENSLFLPAGILQGSFFSHDRPRYMNYGGISFVIGHEITHGFDDQGRQYDKEGNIVEWWEQETKKEYLSKAECIIHQYGNYTAKEVGMNLSGINTQGENIADNGGIKVSYLAYQEWVNQNKPESKLPGLKYSPSQLFWISAAQTSCSKYRPEKLIEWITTNPHSPEEFRILGSFSNRPEFARDFQCPIGSRMNPKKKCSVW